MAAPASLDWLFLLGGAIVGLVGLALFAWALFRDRSRGRRRCPSCWYDMSGTPDLKCSECGHDARFERRLYRTRRRWKWAVLGVTGMLLGGCIAEVPAYKRGWSALVPTTALALFAPAQDPTNRAVFFGVALNGQGTATIVNGRLIASPPSTPPPTPVRAAAPFPQQLTDEFWSRLQTRRTRGWQARQFFRRYFSNNPVDFSAYLLVPDRWPVGEPIRVSVRTVPVGSVVGLGIETIARRMGSEDEAIGQGAGFVGGTPVAAQEIDVEMRLQYLSQVIYRTSTRVPITVAGSVATFLDQLNDATSTALVKEAIKPRLVWDAEDPLLLVNDRSESEAWRRIDFGVVYRVELLIGEQMVGFSTGAADWVRPVWKDWDEIRFSWAEGGRERASATPEQVRIVIRGDPVAAGRMYMDAPFGKRPACWVGEIELPAAAVLKENQP